MSRIISKIFVLMFAFVFSSHSIFAADTSGPGLMQKMADPSFEMDKRTIALFNYELPYDAFTQKQLSLKDFTKKNLLVFYFSATCPHCQNAIPYVLKYLHENKNLSMVAIAIKNNSASEIGDFINKYKVDVPLFQDNMRSFSDKYGTGSVPVAMLVNKNGNYIIYKSFDHIETLEQITRALSNPKKFPE